MFSTTFGFRTIAQVRAILTDPTLNAFVGLFGVPFDPALIETAADAAAKEASFAGYARQGLGVGAWSLPFTYSGIPCIASTLTAWTWTPVPLAPPSPPGSDGEDNSAVYDGAVESWGPQIFGYFVGLLPGSGEEVVDAKLFDTVQTLTAETPSLQFSAVAGFDRNC